MIGPTALFLSSHVHHVYSLLRCAGFDADTLLLLVQLVSAVPEHFLIACSLTNSTRDIVDRQMVPADSYDVDDPPQWLGALKDPVSPGAIVYNPISTLVGWQPNLRRIVDRKYAPVPANAVARAKSGMCPMS